MSLLALPSETLDSVCRLALQTDLLALATTNKRLSALARRLLYHTINVSEGANNKACVFTLAKNLYLAQAVRHFHISLPRSPTGVFPAYIRVLRNALVNMTRLLTLGIFMDDQPTWVLDCDAALYPHLRSFACDFPLDTKVAGFLHRCPSIEDLQLDVACQGPRGGALVPSIHPSDLSHLRTFVGATDAAAVLVPGRPVTAIHLHMDAFDGDGVLSALSCSAAPVTSVHAVIGPFSLQLLQSIAYHLPHVEDLRVSALHAFDALPDAAFLSKVTTMLDAFENLCSFELSGVHWTSHMELEGQKKSWQREPLPFCAEEKQSGDGYDWEVQGDFLDQEGWAMAAW